MSLKLNNVVIRERDSMIIEYKTIEFNKSLIRLNYLSIHSRNT